MMDAGQRSRVNAEQIGFEAIDNRHLSQQARIDARKLGADAFEHDEWREPDTLADSLSRIRARLRAIGGLDKWTDDPVLNIADLQNVLTELEFALDKSVVDAPLRVVPDEPATWGHGINLRYLLAYNGLVPNGNGFLQSNYNFPDFTFDPVDAAAGFGSFYYDGRWLVALSTNFVPVSPYRQYLCSVLAKAGNADGSGYNSANKQYVGFTCYDSDFLEMSPYHYLRYAGSVNTTLAAQLNPGDTQVQLTSSAGWATGGFPNAYFAWWPYSGANGLIYAPYTYSRNTSSIYYGGATPGTGTWSSIAGNNLNLVSAWAGPSLPANTPVSNFKAGSQFKYTLLSGVAVPNTWTLYQATLAGLDSSGSGSATLLPYGTRFLKVLFLLNWHNPPATGDVIRYCDLAIVPK